MGRQFSLDAVQVKLSLVVKERSKIQSPSKMPQGNNLMKSRYMTVIIISLYSFDNNVLIVVL